MLNAMGAGLFTFLTGHRHRRKLALDFVKFGVSWAVKVLAGIIEKETSATCNVRGLTSMNWLARGS